MARRNWFSIHRWLGIFVGAWFALVGLTGAILVYEDPIDAWLNPALLASDERGPPLPMAQLLERATVDYDLGQIDRIRLPVEPGEVWRLVVREKPGRRVGVHRHEVTFSPVTGRLLGSRETETLGLAPPYLLKTLYEFHRNVLLGHAGSNIVGVAGLLLFTSTLTGLVLALPRKRHAWRRLVWINWRASATRIQFDVHRSTGALCFLLLLLATTTGFTLVYLNYVRDLVSVFSKVDAFPTIPWRPGTREPPPPFDHVVAQVAAAYPASRIVEVHLSAQRTSGYLFYLRAPGDEHRLGDTIVWTHPSTGEILVERSDRTRNGGETFMHWLFPLHSGTAFGEAGKVAMAVTGMLPLLLVFTGLWVWLRKRRGERIARERRATATAVPQESAARGSRVADAQS
jgi:uncharacterized iron-regulated membrane protein